MSGSMQSNVGGRQAYEAGDQRPPKLTGPDLGRLNNDTKYGAAPENAHQDLDSKDQRTLKNQLGSATKNQHEADAYERKSNAQPSDPLKPAREHGNEPSRGAKKDAEIMQDEEEYLKQKGKI